MKKPKDIAALEAKLLQYAVPEIVDDVRQQLQIVLSNAGILKVVTPAEYVENCNKIENAVAKINQLVYDAFKKT